MIVIGCITVILYITVSGLASPEPFGVNAIREWSNRTDRNTVGWVGNVLY